MADRGRRSGKVYDEVIDSSDAVYDLFCDVCAEDEDDKHLEATGYCVECRDYLCQDCVKAHGKQRPSRNHVVHTKRKMQRQKPMQPLLSKLKPIPEPLIERCDKHPGRPVEYYCTDDSSLCCTVCLVKHRQCKNLDHISDLSDNLLDSEDYHQFKDTLNNLKRRSQTVIEHAKENTIHADRLCTDVATAFQELRKKINDAFDNLEDEIKRKAETIKSNDVQKMKTITDKGIDVLNEVYKIILELYTLESNNQLDQLYIRMMKLEGRAQALYSTLDEADTSNCISTYIFESGSLAHELIKDQASIGKLSEQIFLSHKPSAQEELSTFKLSNSQATPIASSATESRHMKAVHVSDIRMRTHSDTKECLISGSALLSDDNIVMLDRANHKIKLLNLLTARVTSELSTSSDPWCIAGITDNQVAVSLCNKHKVVFVTVTHELKMDRQMSVNGFCTGILHNNGKLIVAFCKQVKIEIMDLNGVVEKMIECNNLISKPIDMTFSLDHDAIYIADDEDNCIKRLSLEGVVEAEYRDEKLIAPRNVIVDQWGNVMVCCSDTHNIHLLTPDLAKIKLLVESLSCPESLSLCHSTGRLFVGRMDNDVRVFQLSQSVHF